MPLLYYNPTLLEHRTGQHPERPERVLHAMRHLERTGLAEACVRPEWEPAAPARLLRVHDRQYLAELERFSTAGGGRIEADTVCSLKSWEVARLAAGAACDAVVRVASGAAQTAFCLIRPPGHHALPDAAMGFCLLANAAIAARVATEELGLDRVLIVDWDVHHGNGTQAIFWEDPRIGFFSIHRFPFYPGSGAEEETGGGGGLGTTCNVPIRYGTPPAEYIARFRTRLEQFADRIRPQLILISAGFDAHRDDPVGSLDLETEDFRTLTEIVTGIARTHANGQIVSVLEGGYNTSALAGCVATHVEALEEDGGKTEDGG